jgi:hypothetical protein
MQMVPPKILYPSTKLHGVISRRAIILRLYRAANKFLIIRFEHIYSQNIITFFHNFGGRGKAARPVKLTTYLHLVPRSRMMELHLHFPHVFVE